MNVSGNKKSGGQHNTTTKAGMKVNTKTLSAFYLAPITGIQTS
jgi:hypothetical protein